MKRLAIVGAGAFGQQIAQHVAQAGAYHVAGFFEDSAAAGTTTPYGPILGSVASVRDAYQQDTFDEVLLGIGYNLVGLRQRLFDEIAATVPFGRFVHPTSYVDSSARVGIGTFVSPGCLLDLNVELEVNTFLYTGCILAHDSRVGRHSFLAPAVRLSGGVRVGPRCFLGVSTTVIDGCVLGAEVRTGGGTVVTQDLPEDGTYVGAPARRLGGGAVSRRSPSS